MALSDVLLATSADAGGSDFTTTTGGSWSAVTSSPFGVGGQSVAWAPDLRLLVLAAGSDGPWHSPDAATWTGPTSYSGGSAARVAWSPDLALFVLWDSGGVLYTSTDGKAWTARPGEYFETDRASAPLFAEWVPGLGRFIAAVDGGAIAYSTNGVDWTPATTDVGATRQTVNIAYSPTLDRLVIVGRSGSSDPGVFTSDDGGVTWTERFFSPIDDYLRAVVWSANLGLFVAGGEIGWPAVSSDGVSWSASGFSITGSPIWSMGYSPETGVIAGGDFQGTLFTSTDAENWTESSVFTNEVSAILWAAEGNAAPNAPLVTDQGTFNRAAVNRVTWQFSDPDPGDSQSAAELRYRESGTSTWTTVNIGTPNQFWDAPAGTFVADLYEAQVRTADQAGEWGPFSASFFITAGDAPPGPTFLDPTNGQTIGQSSYTGQVSVAAAAEVEWRLYADNGGVIDTGTVVQGPVVKATGDMRSHTFTGLANNVTVWWSVRVKHDGLWSQPAQIRTPVSYTPPPAPVVAYTHVPAEGAVDIAVTNPAPGAGEPPVSYNDIEVRDPGEDWERRATMLAPNGTWRYWTPPSGFDPATGVRVAAVADNGTTASTEGATEA